jgi:hypothetical protein
MSSCDASCSICCRPVSCASATSDSSPTGTALRCCRCACDYSADHSKTQLRRHHRSRIRLMHFGTVQSAAEPCGSSNGSLLPNSCFDHHHNQTSTQHEALFKSSLTARVSERIQIPCPIWRGWLGRLALRTSTDASLWCLAHPSQRHNRTSNPTWPVPDPLHPLRPIQNT